MGAATAQAGDGTGVRVRFVGSGDAFGSGGRFQACVLLDAGGLRVLLDCGATSLVALRRLGLDPGSVDAIVISHLHGDHFGGLPFLVLDGQFRRRTRALEIVGPAGVEGRLRETMEALFPGSSRVERRFAVTCRELRERESAAIGGLTVTGFPVVHPSGAPALALRVTAGGAVIAYSGDTEWTDVLLEAAREADLFIVEAYTFERRVKYHLDYASLAARRSDLRCRRIILTHPGEEFLGRQGDVDRSWAEVAEDGMLVQV